MMNGAVPGKASSPTAPGLALSSGGLVAAKSGTSYPTHFVPSHHTHFFRSLHGRPCRSADARLYMIRRLAGHAQPQLSWAPGCPGGSGVWLAVLALLGVLGLVVPHQRLEARVAGRRRILVERLEALADLVGEPGIGAALPGRVRRPEVPLEHALGVGEAALVLRHLRRREEEDFRLDVLDLDLAALHLGRVLPERRALVEPVVLHHQPLELAHPGALQLGVERRGGVLADEEHAL